MPFLKSAIFTSGLLLGAGVVWAANAYNKPVEQASAHIQAQPERNLPVISTNNPATQAVDDHPTEQYSAPDEVLLQELIERVTGAEERIAELEDALSRIDTSTNFNRRGNQRTNESTAVQLVDAGFDPFVAEQIESVRNDVQLQRLELRDTATREGWVGTDRFRESMRELGRDSGLRQSLGDEDYDRLLIAEGRNNRILVDEIIENSAADIAGFESGDVVYRYADDRIFNFRDLRRATSAGQRDQPVSVQVLRDGDLIEIVVPRGPLGVTISGVARDG